MTPLIKELIESGKAEKLFNLIVLGYSTKEACIESNVNYNGYIIRFIIDYYSKIEFEKNSTKKYDLGINEKPTKKESYKSLLLEEEKELNYKIKQSKL